MLFWAIVIVLSALAALCVLLPLARRDGGGSKEPQGLDLYRAQLADVDVRLEADPANQSFKEERAEIVRRIIRADRREKSLHAKGGSRSTSRLVAPLVAILGIPAIALPVYLTLGSPQSPDAPLADQKAQNLENLSVDQLVRRAESHLETNPDDAKGWALLADVYARLNRLSDRALALRQLIRLLGPSADRLADLGEILTAIDQNVVSAEARTLFERALKQEQNHRKAQFFMALALEQEGRHADSLPIWQALSKLSPQSAQWQKLIAERIDIARRGLGLVTRGPSAEQVESAGEMDQQDRATMIEGMVASLAAKLQDKPDNLQGWRQLIRAYMVLQKPDEARAALTRAKQAFAGNSAAVSQLDDFARSLNVMPAKEEESQ